MNLPTAVSRRDAMLLALAGVVAGTSSSRADDYPSRPVKIVAPFGAGGPTDVYTRSIANELQKSLGQTFFIEDRPGAGTTIGTDLVAHAAPDGYTLLMVSGTQTVNETLYTQKPYQLMRDLTPVAPLMDTDLVLVVHPVGAGEDPAGASGAGARKTRHAQLRLIGAGLELPHGGRAFEKPHRHRHRACAVQGLDRHAQRHFERTDPNAVRLDSRPWRRPFNPAWSARSPPAAGPARRSCPTCRPSPKPACPVFRRHCGSASWRRKRRRSRSSISSAAAITDILKRPDIKDAWEKQGASPMVMTQAVFTAFMESEIAKWAKVIQANHIALIN